MPAPKWETHSSAWSRVFGFRKHGKGGAWVSDTGCPIRMRGYTELWLGDLDAKLRKKIDTALRRGYALERNSQLRPVLDMLEKVAPKQMPPIGYVGKTELSLFLATEDEADDFQRELNANTVMTEAFKGSRIVVRSGRNGWWLIYVDLFKPRGEGGCTKHMAPCFTELRVTIDEWMKPGASVREEFARWCAEDNRVIKIPFDSHLKRGVK